MSDANGASSKVAADTFTKVIMTTLAGLLGMGVGGLWQMSNNVARLEERLANTVVWNEKSILALQLDVRDHSARIRRLELRSLGIPYDPDGGLPEMPRNAVPPITKDERRRP